MKNEQLKIRLDKYNETMDKLFWEVDSGKLDLKGLAVKLREELRKLYPNEKTT